MSVGQVEKKTQARVVKLFREKLGYDYLGNWIDREGNRNIEPELLRAFLRKQGHDEALIGKVLYLLEKAAGDTSKSLYDRNRAVYDLLRYGVKVKPDVGENTQTVWLIDWEQPDENHFAIAEEVTVPAADAKAHDKRPDVVLYVNGIALGVLELKRSTVSVAEGIRQNLDNQKKDFIEPFFSTMQFVMAGNDTEGLRYGVIETPEKYYLAWKEESDDREPARPRSDAALRQGALPRTDPRLHRLRRRHQEALPPQPVLRRPRRAGVVRPPRGRHHLAHPGLGQEPDDGLAGQVDPRARARRARADHHRPHRARRADREGLQRRQRGDLPHQERRGPDRQAERDQRRG